jgi:hypothetical protein
VAPFPWIVLVAYLILLAAPAINRWLDARADQLTRRGRLRVMASYRVPDRPVQATIRRPNRELDRRRP